MKSMELTPVTDIKRRATKIIAEVARERRPVMITQRGRSAAVLIDVESFEDMRARLEILEGIARGEREIDEGRGIPHGDVKRYLRNKWRALRG